MINAGQLLVLSLFPCVCRGGVQSPSDAMNTPSIPITSSALSQCGSEQEQHNTIVRPAQCQKKSRSETKSRHTWSKDDNKQLMKLYFQSNPSRSGYRRRLHSLWMDAQLFPRTEQQLADQARSIRVNNLLSDIELLEIQGSIPQLPPTPHHQGSQVTSHVRDTPTVSTALAGEDPPTVSQAVRRIRDTLPVNSHSSTTPPTVPPTTTEPSSSERDSIIQQLSALIADPSLIQVKPLRHVNRKS